MAYKDDFSLEKMFIEHKVQITEDGEKILEINLPSIADHYKMPDFNIFLNILNNKDQYIKIFKLIKVDASSDYDICKYIILYNYYRELKQSSQVILNTLSFLCDDIIQIQEGKMCLVKKSLTLDEDLFNYILYLFRKSEGIQVEPPRTFKSESERQKYLEQLAREERIRKIRATGIKMDKDGKPMQSNLMQNINIILYAYPQYKAEDLFNFTFLQLKFLQENAGKIIKYQIESAAYSAGNLKKLKNFWE